VRGLRRHAPSGASVAEGCRAGAALASARSGGDARDSHARSPLRLSTRLAGLELEDWRGEPVALGSLWQRRPLALVFIRHFG
jgi:hypothetical protein